MWMANWLSQFKVTGFKEWTPISSSNLTSQVTSAAAYDIARYSASEDDLDMVLCFSLFQLMGGLPKRIRQPVIDLLENGQATQSESEYGCNESWSEACNKIPFPTVAETYLILCINA